MALFKLGLKVVYFWVLLQTVDSEHVRVTLERGRTEIGAFELTVPALVKTMTELSMVTVTQVSMETTTVEGACSATAPIATALAMTRPSSSLSSFLQTPAPVATVTETPSPAEFLTTDIGRPSDTSTRTVVQLPNTSQEPCNCQCLCPQSAFQVYDAMGATPEKSTPSTLPSLVTAGQRLLPAGSSISLAVSSSPVPSKSLGLTSGAASLSTGPTVTTIQPSRNEPFNINTYSLLDAVTIALSL